MATVNCLSLFLVLSVVLGQTQARLFTFQIPGTDTTCIMVDVDLKVEIQAIKNRQVIATKALTTEDKGVTSNGMCATNTSELLIHFDENTFFYVAFRPPPSHPAPVAQYRGFQFVPAEVFGKVTEVTTQMVFYDARSVYQKNIDDSYYCDTPDQTEYSSQQPGSQEFNFVVNVTVFSLQSQGFNIKNNKFGPREQCDTPASLH
ncbi:hypothetical protein RRG08_020886 [Elysia crispata]|uniref:Uncharacterized protein n=1 Tax=Elysia crispata TaxID=231223 RepID=A0AAE1D823_9GAST|nr:hypothetical protein RRG08_020886 [Elysia crispata]